MIYNNREPNLQFERKITPGRSLAYSLRAIYAYIYISYLRVTMTQI